MEHANCLLWRAQVREYRRTPEWQVPPFDAERNTSLHFDMQIMNEAEVHWWLPLERREGEPFAVSWYLARHPGDSAEGDRRLHTALHGGLGRYTQTFRTSVEGGGLRWLQEDVRIEVLSPIPEVNTDEVTDENTGEEGELMRRWQLTGVVTDVTERKQVEERLEALASELRRSNNHLQEFAYIASHDLKEPLRKIRTFADMLCRQASARLEGDDRECLDRMVSAAERMARLIDGLLQYSRVSRRPTTSVPVPLDEVMAGVLSDLEVRIAEAGARIDIGPLPTIPGDALELRQLFQNLIANSLKFQRSGVPPVVTVTAEQRSPGAVTLVFADNGIGFAPEHAERIFSLFERLEARNRFEGNGIGLTICRKIAERHGGAITAIGVEGVGATFEVWLPLEAPAEPH
jgi:signal transduction histidine kinase